MPELYQYVTKSQFVEALNYIKNSSENPIEEAFTRVDGRSVIHILLEKDPGTDTEATALLDEIVAQRVQKFIEREFFLYTLTSGRYKQLRHLLWHPNVLSDGKTCLSVQQISQLLNWAVDHRSVEGTQVLLDFAYQLPLIFEGNENSPYVKAVTSENLKLFLVFANTLKNPLSDEICKTVLLAISQEKVSNEITNQFLKGLPLLQKRNLILWAVWKDYENIFELLLPVVECDSLRIEGTNGTIFHYMASRNSIKCLDEMMMNSLFKWFPLLDIQDNEGKTALYVAAKENRSTIVQKLLFWGADYRKFPNGVSADFFLHTVAPKDSQSQQMLINAEYGGFAVNSQVQMAHPLLFQKRREEGVALCCHSDLSDFALDLVITYHLDPSKALLHFYENNFLDKVFTLITTYLQMDSSGEVSDDKQLLSKLSCDQKEELIYDAIEKDNEKVFELILFCIDLKSLRSEEYNGTILHYMAACNSVKCLDVLRSKMPKVLFSIINIPDNKEKTALFVAAKLDKSEVVKRLLLWGADYCITPKWVKLLFDSDRSAIDILLELGKINEDNHFNVNNFFRTEFCKSLYWGMRDSRVGDYFLSSVAPANSKSLEMIERAEAGFFTVDPEVEKSKPDLIQNRRENGIVFCLWKNNPKRVLELILTYKLDIAPIFLLLCKLKFFEKAMRLVSLCFSSISPEKMLDNKKFMSTIDSYADDLYLTAVSEDDEKVFELLLPYINGESLRRGKAQGTILHYMAECNSIKCLNVLKRKMPKVLFSIIDKQDNEGQTALFVAAKLDRSEIVEKLLGWGADCWLTPKKFGKNFSMHEVIPKKSGSESSKARDLLMSAEKGFFSIDPEVENAKPDIMRKRRERGLFTCCAAGSVKDARSLISIFGVNPNARTENGETPLYLLFCSNAKSEEIEKFAWNLRRILNFKDINKDHQTALWVASQECPDREFSNYWVFA